MRYSFSRRYKAAPIQKDNAEARSLKQGLFSLTVFSLSSLLAGTRNILKLLPLPLFRIDREIGVGAVFFKIWSLVHKLIFNLFNNQH